MTRPRVCAVCRSLMTGAGCSNGGCPEAEPLADDCCEDCGVELEPVYAGRTTADPADERMECPCCGERRER